MLPKVSGAGYPTCPLREHSLSCTLEICVLFLFVCYSSIKKNSLKYQKNKRVRALSEWCANENKCVGARDLWFLVELTGSDLGPRI